MGWNAKVLRAAVIACASALLLFCALPVHAQTSNDDRYGFVPVPPPVIPPEAMPQVQPAYLPPNPAPTMPVQQAPMPMSAPMPAPMAPPVQQAFTPAPAEPYGYVPLRSPQPSGAPYGMQTAANPPGYYPGGGYGQGIDYGYALGPGDKVRVSVYGEDDLSGEYQIDGSGNIQLPLIGIMRAAGSTAPALQSVIAGALAQGYLKNPRVSVEITVYRPFYIIGAVNRPGQYPYVNNMSALDAVAVGGGFTDKAKDSVVYVRHEGSTREEELPASQVTLVRPGDVIRVKSTVFWDAMDAFSPLAGPAAIAAAAIQ